MKTAYGYCRVSTGKQINGYGLDRQREEIENYCKRNKIELIKVYEEQVSGIKGEDERPIYHEIVKACKTDDVKMIVIDTLDRFARRWSVSDALFVDLAVKGIDVVVASTGENITQSIKDSPIRKFIVHVLGGIAELDYGVTCDRLKKGRQARVKIKGEWRLPKYGKCGTDCQPEHSERCKREKEIIKRIIYWRSPKRTKKKTYKELAATFNSEGIPTRQNGRWTGMLVFNVAKRQGR